MGQKINPNIFRLGVNKTWKTEFFEKKRHELPLYTFKDLEIKDYIERFLKTQGIFLHDYKQHYSNATLNVYLSCFILPEVIFDKKDTDTTLILVNSLGKQKVVIASEMSAKRSFLLEKSLLFNTKSIKEFYLMKKYFKSGLNSFNLANSIQVLNQQFIERTTYSKIEGELNNFLKVLSLFTNDQFNIILTFCCINKDLNFLKRIQKKNFILLQKFKGTLFLKESIELLFHVVHNKTSANLLVKFIALQIKKIKRHKFFFSFLKQSLTILANSSFSKVKGIKIIIKGRLNGVPRAKHKILTIGDVPVQSIDANINYSQTTTHNANGSYGIKVWIIEK